jgi:hypothetical protein
MCTYCFKDNLIDQNFVKIAFNVMPLIELSVETTHLFELGRELKNKYPNLFESLVESPSEFSIRKKFTIFGQGEVEQKTLVIGQFGMELNFPLKLAAFQDKEICNVPDKSDIIKIVNCFKNHIHNKKILRVGYIDERYYSVDTGSSVPLIRERFTHIAQDKIPDDGEIFLRFNLCTDDYNRVVSIESVVKKALLPSGQTASTAGHGIKVVIDFNNRSVEQDLDENHIVNIIANANIYIKNNLPDFLNCPEET